MKDYIALSDRIGAKKYSMVLTVLNRNTDLDMTYENGTFFITAIEQNSCDIVSILLDYFQKNQLNKYFHPVTQPLLCLPPIESGW